jgi:Zn-dependent peptidase ImmA (M78 family)/predicted secreted protein
MTNYASAVRRAAMAAARLHRDLGSEAKVQREGGNIDVFEIVARMRVTMLFRPLRSLLGAFLNNPVAGILVTTERPLSVQRLTAAHEFGHFHLKHEPSLDDETILRRSPFVSAPDYGLQEVEADAFAIAFLTPRWLIAAHCERQGWGSADLRLPPVVYQLSLRIGASYEATCWTLARYRFISTDLARKHATIQPRELKRALLGNYRPENFRGDVWHLTKRDAGAAITGSRADLFVLQLPEHSGGGYLWNIDELKERSFVVVRDEHEDVDAEEVGGHPTRRVTAESRARQSGTMHLLEYRPWQPTKAINNFTLVYDLNGPETEGYSRPERRYLPEAA